MIQSKVSSSLSFQIIEGENAKATAFFFLTSEDNLQNRSVKKMQKSQLLNSCLYEALWKALCNVLFQNICHLEKKNYTCFTTFILHLISGIDKHNLIFGMWGNTITTNLISVKWISSFVTEHHSLSAYEPTSSNYPPPALWLFIIFRDLFKEDRQVTNIVTETKPRVCQERLSMNRNNYCLSKSLCFSCWFHWCQPVQRFSMSKWWTMYRLYRHLWVRVPSRIQGRQLWDWWVEG